MTTIQAPTDCVRRLCGRLMALGIRLLVMGDKKGPWTYDTPGAELVTLTQQGSLPFKLAPLLPKGHYVRKNLGYLLAMREGAHCIYETDDDNAPNSSWHVREEVAVTRRAAAAGWYNVYRLFSEANIWPRGFPLDKVTAPLPDQRLDLMTEAHVTAPIQQGLANGSPDVDAVWRLVLDRDFRFRDGPSVLLPRNTWCPFNSQSTWWRPSAFALMYLPSHCSFRMTDIWRSFIAQRCLWEFAEGMVFHGPEVDQERNVHNLMRDFADEVPGYLQNARIADLLQGLALKPGIAAVVGNLLACYEALIDAEIFPAEERALVGAWAADVQRLAGGAW